MNEPFLRRKLTPFNIALAYAYVGGILFFFSTHALSYLFIDPIAHQRIEILNYWLFILISAVLLYLLIRSSERSLTRAHRSLERVSRALKTRSECTQAMLRAPSEQVLMQQTCRLIVEEGGYLMAWVGLREQDEAQTVRPAAQWGFEDGYLDTARISWGDNEWGQGPTATAIRSGQLSQAQHDGAWRQEARKRGYAATIAMPLLDGGECVGALAIYAREDEVFDADEVELLQALADDLAYGILTQRLRMEKEQAKQERQQLAKILEQGTEGVLTFDPQGIIRYVNPAFERNSGCPKENLIGHSLQSLHREGRNRAFYQAALEALSRQEARTDHLLNVRRDGSQYEIISRVTPIFDPVGAITGYAVVVRDVTHEVLLERQLRQAQKMEVIATLSGGIAHDFNNILASIITCSELALDDVPLNSPQRKLLEVIHRGGQRGRELVRQIRSLSRQNEQEKKPVNMQAVLEECVKLLRPSFPASIEIRCKVLPGLGQVMADPTQMHQVLINLCTNAAHAMAEKGGVLEISLANLDLDLRAAATFPELKAGPYLRLTVKDSGQGMPVEVQEHIFDPFFTTKGQGEGTGLGLSVVHGIIKHHSGTIVVSSEVGKGSMFQVYLPRIPGLAQALQADAPLPAVSGGGRILFVDDEEDIVFSGENMLTRLGYEVVSSRSAQEALALFRRQPEHYDLVITDLTMPQMSGDQLADELVRLRPDIPIILCTGFGPGFRSALSSLEMRSEGIREVVMKPFDRTDMAAAIRRALA